MKGYLLLLCGLFVLITYGQQSFQANFEITHTLRNGAKMSGTIYYKYSLGKFRLDYDSGQVEFYNSVTKQRTRKCTTSCVNIPFFESIPEFFKLSGDVAGITLVVGRPCIVYKKPESSSQALQWVAIDGNNIACQALLINGIQFTFTNLNNASTFADTYLDEKQYCQLNSPQCNNKLDIYFIGDESGSVTQAGFNSEISFMKSVLNILDISDGGVHAGITFFSDIASVAQELTGDKTRLTSALDTHVYKDGNTCIYCGLDLASLNFEALNGASRANVAKLFVVISDGKNNRPLPQATADARLLEAATRAHGIVDANGGACVAIGVGSSFNTTELKKIVTKDKYMLTVSGFDSLKTITNEVLSSSCDDSDYICENTCATGFCLCGTCIGCPGGCPGASTTGTDGVGSKTPDEPVSIGVIVALIIAGVVLLAGAVLAVVFYLKKKKNPTTKTKTKTDEERPNTVEIGERSERFSKVVRKFSVTDEDRPKISKKDDGE